MIKTTILYYFSIFLGVFFIVAGNGLMMMYFPVYAKSEVTASEIGIISSAYYVGFFIGCIKILSLIRRVGFVRSFSFASTLIGLSALSFTMSNSTLSWLPLRFIMGIGHAGFYVVIESWINTLANNNSRGRVYGIYRFVELGSLAIGQHFLVLLAGETAHYHFSMVTFLTFLSVIPLSLTLLPQPIVEEGKIKVTVNIKSLWENSQYSTMMMFLIGMVTSVIWMLTPLMLIEKGVNEVAIPRVFSFFIIGGILSQYPLGFISDKYERRSITNYLSLISLIVISLFMLKNYFNFQLHILFFLLGTFVMPQYSLVMTHAMDRAGADSHSNISSQMLLLYSIGAIVGPIICGLYFRISKINGYSLYLGSVLAIMLIFGLLQARTRPAVSSDEKMKFKVFPELTPIIFLFKRFKKRHKEDKNNFQI